MVQSIDAVLEPSITMYDKNAIVHKWDNNTNW